MMKVNDGIFGKAFTQSNKKMTVFMLISQLKKQKRVSVH